MRWTERERKIQRILSKKILSPSHEFDHLKRVSEYSFELARRYKGRRDIVVAAALLHDISRSDKKYRGAESAKRAATLARSILVRCGYKRGEIELISRCIAEHDQPSFKSALLESRILKDADFLDGFGARGIFRGVMYAGETGGGLADVLRRLGKTGRRRLDGLEFIESRRLGWRLHRLTELFLVELEDVVNLNEVSYSGKFIVIEGISGSGKDTQAKLLAEFISESGKKVKVVNHPTVFLKKLWRQWRTEVDDRFSELFLLLADRSRMVKETIIPQLQKGKVVISTRSQISAQVYQKVEDVHFEYYRYLFSFEPVADLYLYLDVSAKEALKRADKRVSKGIEKNRGFFGKEQEKQRKLYRRVLSNYPNVKIINANDSVDEVATGIQKAMNKSGILFN